MYPLHCLHTFGLHAKANYIITLDDSSHAALKTDQPFWILGQGSNCIFTEDFAGTIFKIASMGKQITELADVYEITVKAGESWHQLVVDCLEKGIYGLENLALIPGTVGAAPMQNIGAYGVELQQFIERVVFTDIKTGKSHFLRNDECKFGYRDSIFKSELSQQVVITDVVLHIPKQWQPCIHYGELQNLAQPTAQQIFNKVVEIRSAKLPDPARIGNAGSFFKNPIIDPVVFETLGCQWQEIPHFKQANQHVKIHAAWLIDTLGYKGKKVGGIQCHPLQPLVLTNDGTGTGSQVLELAREIRDAVANKFSIRLENEVRLLGKQGTITL